MSREGLWAFALTVLFLGPAITGLVLYKRDIFYHYEWWLLTIAGVFTLVAGFLIA